MKFANKKIFCVVTSSRAEFGILRNLLLELKNDTSITMQLIVTGSHLSKKHGFTIKEIVKSNLNIYKKMKQKKITGGKRRKGSFKNSKKNER